MKASAKNSQLFLLLLLLLMVQLQKNARDMSSSLVLPRTISVYGSEYSHHKHGRNQATCREKKSQPKHMLYLIDACYGGLAKSRSMSKCFYSERLGHELNEKS
jgi:hypothetical protein